MIAPRNNMQQIVSDTIKHLGETLTSFIRHSPEEPHRWVIALANDESFLLIEVLFQNGGIVGGILENNGVKALRAGRIMNELMNRLHFEE